MELLNSGDREALNRFHTQLQGKSDNQNIILYSDILTGKYSVDELETITQQSSMRNSAVTKQDRVKVARNPSQQSQQFGDLMSEFNKVQQKCADNIFKFGALVDNPLSDKKNSDLNYKPNASKSQASRSRKSIPQSSTSLSKVSQQCYNEKLLEQIERLLKIKTINNQFLHGVIKKHLSECPQFGKTLQAELKSTLESLK